MPAIHDETRSRWEQYPPERFIQQVIHGTLHEKVNTAYTVIHVYTQILHQLPATAVMEIQTPGEFEATHLRELFVEMRDSIAAVHETSEDETPTLPADYTPGD